MELHRPPPYFSSIVGNPASIIHLEKLSNLNIIQSLKYVTSTITTSQSLTFPLSSVFSFSCFLTTSFNLSSSLFFSCTRSSNFSSFSSSSRTSFLLFSFTSSRLFFCRSSILAWTTNNSNINIQDSRSGVVNL